MKKRVMGCFAVGMLVLGFSSFVRAEEVQGTKTNESIMKVEEKGKLEKAEEPKKEVDSTNTVDMVGRKEALKYKIKNLSYSLSADKISELLGRVDKIATVDELIAMEQEIDRLGNENSLKVEKDSYSEVIKNFYNQGKLTQEEKDKLLKRIADAKTIKEIETIYNEISHLVNPNAITEKKEKLVAKIKELVNQGKLTKEQGDGFLKRVEASMLLEEWDQIEAEVDKQVKANEESAGEIFKEKYTKIEKGINQYVEQGKLTKEQGDKFLAQLKNCQTIEALDTLWNEVEKQLKDVTTNSKPSTNNPKLPQTGEKSTIVNAVIGLLAISGVGIVYFRRNK